MKSRQKALLWNVIIISILFLPTFLIAKEKVKIAIWGDSRENFLGTCENIAQHLLYKTTDWDFQVHTGDFTSTGSQESWEKSLNYKGVDSVFVKDRFFMCTSNHDLDRENYNKYTSNVMPINSLDSTTHFYHYQKGNVHIVAVDAYFTNPEVMNNWLDSELAKIPEDDWLIGFWHNPCYDHLTNKEGYYDTCSPWLEKFYEHGGDFILHGHAHMYVRTHPLMPDGRVDPQKGMVHIINGCGGADFKAQQEVTEKTAYTPSQRSFGCITFISFEEDKATVETVDVRTLINYGTIDKWTWDKSEIQTGIEQNNTLSFTDYQLKQNYPNPFNPTTTIRYTLGTPGYVQLEIFDITGKNISTLVHENQNAGNYYYDWTATDAHGNTLPSGTYFCQIQCGDYRQTIKMLLLR